MSNVAQNTAKRRGRPPRQPAALSPDKPEIMAEAIVEADRPSMRPAMREEDPRAAAARRAAEIRANYSEDDGVDEFKLPPAPAGWTYEWKAKAVLGQINHAHMTELYRMGWEEVPTVRHPEEMPLQGNHPVIERKGMVLMQRPTVIVEEARAMQISKAKSQVKFKEEQLNGPPEGGLGHRDHAQVKPKISKGYEPIPVPKD
jgi:hypothetical protein